MRYVENKKWKKIRPDLNVCSINDKIEEKKIDWRDHVDKMVENRLMN